MLQLITGRSGSGKTALVFRELKQYAAEQAPLFLLVPEQASFENERQLLTELGPTLAQRVRVLSFTRLTEIVFREVGGLNGKRMNDTLALLLMSQALHSVRDTLTAYHRHVDDPDYLRSVLEMLKECKQCAVTPRAMEETAATLPDGLLRDKLHDLAMIFTAYESLVAQASLVDPQDDLTWLSRHLAESHLFVGSRVYVDGFKGFTAQELTVLERLLPQAEAVTVTLCAEEVTLRHDHEFDRFATAVRTAEQLRDAAYRAHVPVAAVRHLSDNHRQTDPALRLLEETCFTATDRVYDGPIDRVCLVECTDRVEECRYAARLIRRLLREEGGHCRGFTVVARDMNAYSDYMDSALRREGLPCCRDYREPVLTQPLIALVESALAAVTGNYAGEDVLRMVKTGLLGFSTASASLLENYVLMWNVRGAQWHTPFTAHPDGLSAVENDRSRRRLQYIDLLRRRLMRPLETFAARVAEQPTGRAFAEAVYSLLTDLRVPRCIRLQTARLDAQNEAIAADHQARMWEYLMELLDTFAAALADTRLPLPRFAALFHLAVSADDLGSIPQSLDGVILGAADRIRYARPKTVIVLGANEGVFPAYPAGNGMLTDLERRQLIAAGLPVADSSEGQTAEERFFAYMAVAAPRERLVVTYAKRQGNEELFPSALVAAIKTSLPGCHPVTAATETCESEEDTFAAMALRYRENTAEAASLRAVFSSLPAYGRRLEAMRRLETGFSFQQPAEAQRLFGEHLTLSPSQVETFHQCRFAYFCKYGLHAQPRKTAEWNAAEAGTLTHYLMRELLPLYCEQGLDTVTREAVCDDTRQTVQRYAAECLGGTAEGDVRQAALLERLTQLCQHLLWRVVCELRQSRFVPVDYELPIGDREGIPAWVLTAPDGSTVQVRGVVDRVDVFRKDGRSYLRIIDYKTGKKVFDLSTVLEGVNLQMLIYLFSLCENGQTRYGEIVPSGVLYLPAKIPVIHTARDCDDEQRNREQLKTMCTNGLLLNDEEVLRAMEADLQGVFIPTSVQKGGAIKTKDLVTLQQFGALKRHIQRLLTAMATHLHNGDIDAVPKVDAKGAGMCRYCDYHDICGHEPGDPTAQIAALSTQDALAALEEETGNE